MDVYTLDFETYYDQQYSLSKMTTEEYVRDPRFEVIGLGIKKNEETTKYRNDPQQIENLLGSIDFTDAGIVCQNTMFDGAILSWLYGVKPKAWFDTMCMGRALHGVDQPASLRALSERYGIGEKGYEVDDAKGKHRADFTAQEAKKYGEYCTQDVELTCKLFKIMGAKFPVGELKLIHATLSMFIHPVLDLDLGLLEQHLEDTRDHKDQLLIDAGVEDKKDLMSNPKFASLLLGLGVVPPMKTSLTTGKETYAFAKTDEDFKALQAHGDVRVQTLVAARLGNKSTLEETRTERFIGISKRGLLPAPIKYYAAHTGRWGGMDRLNLQNLPSRGSNGKKLKRAIIAPEGHTVIEADSSQIEARVLAWFAGQADLVARFDRGEDVYKYMAASIYNAVFEAVTEEQRFVGKTTILGAGFNMGFDRFDMQLQAEGVWLPAGEPKRVITVYRETNSNITAVWGQASDMIKELTNGRALAFGKKGVITVDAANEALILPNGLRIFYPDLSAEKSDMGFEYTYKTRRNRTRIYGGKVIENVCQALARCIIGEQILRVGKKYRVALTVHDSILCCVPDAEVPEAKEFIAASMRWTPDWAEGLPVDCEIGTGKSYGDCE